MGEGSLPNSNAGIVTMLCINKAVVHYYTDNSVNGLLSFLFPSISSWDYSTRLVVIAETISVCNYYESQTLSINT